MISVIVRIRNESKWIARCLFALQNQDCENFEILVVDNESTDGSVDIAKQFECRLLKSLNDAIRASNGEFAAILSGHCIPANEHWLRRLRLGFNNPKVAGVYGRQEPLPDTSDFDKRDLWTAFGVERHVQSRDYFFHNANSMIRRNIWEKHPFNESISGVEDRDWAKRVLGDGYCVMYEPTASVYHFHGINHNQDEHRAARVARVIELINNDGQ